MDHSRALRASLAPLPRNWNRPSGRHRHTWLRTVQSDLAPLNIGLATAHRRAQNRQVLSWERLRSTPDKPHDDDDCLLYTSDAADE